MAEVDGKPKTRRARGEGSVFERKRNGKIVGYIGVIQLGAGSSRVERSVSGKTRAEVRDRLKALQATIDSGVDLTSPFVTVGQWLTEWLRREAQPDGIRSKTLKGYEGLVRVDLIPGLGHIKLRQLTAGQVDAFLASKSEGLSPRTRSHLRAVLRNALNDALRDQLVLRNAAALAKAVKIPAREPSFLAVEDARRLLDAARGTRREAIYVLTLSLGLRLGEVLGLSWEDIDFDSNTLTINHSLQRVNGKLILTDPKTQRSKRTIRFHAEVGDCLRRHRKAQSAERIALGPLWGLQRDGTQAPPLVFSTRAGMPYDLSEVSSGFQKFLVANGLPRVRFHDLRHTAASVMYDANVPVGVISQILGHTDINTTLRVYTHMMPKAIEDATEKVGHALWG